MKRPGFTLIEIISVIIVIIILAVVALPRIGNMRLKAAKSGDQASLHILAGAMERAITDGVLTTNNEDVAALVITKTNSFMKMPYVTYPLDNLSIVCHTNWPSYTITITNPIYGTAVYSTIGGQVTFNENLGNGGGTNNNGGGNNGGGISTNSNGVIIYALNYTTDGNGQLSYNSSLIPTVSQSVASGGNATLVVAVAHSGFAFSGWSDGYHTAARTDLNVQNPITVTASFAASGTPPTACNIVTALNPAVNSAFSTGMFTPVTSVNSSNANVTDINGIVVGNSSLAFQYLLINGLPVAPGDGQSVTLPYGSGQTWHYHEVGWSFSVGGSVPNEIGNDGINHPYASFQADVLPDASQISDPNVLILFNSLFPAALMYLPGYENSTWTTTSPIPDYSVVLAFINGTGLVTAPYAASISPNGNGGITILITNTSDPTDSCSFDFPYVQMGS